MALTSTEEAQTRALIAQNAALLSLASSEPTIISKLAATKVSLADLTAATSLSNEDLFLVRQGIGEKSVTKDLLTDSANSNYLPAGTGAIETTVQNKLRESISVKDFGAVGDGVTDDTNAIKAAIIYACSIVSGTAISIYFPAGIYIVGDSVFNMPSYQLGAKFYGDGYYATKVRFKTLTSSSYMYNNGTSENLAFALFEDMGFEGTSPTNYDAGNIPAFAGFIRQWSNGPTQGFKFINCYIAGFDRMMLCEGSNTTSENHWLNCKIYGIKSYVLGLNNVQSFNHEFVQTDIEVIYGDTVYIFGNGGGAVKFFGGSIIPVDSGGTAKSVVHLATNSPGVSFYGTRIELRGNSKLVTVDSVIGSSVNFDSSIIYNTNSSGVKEIVSIFAYVELAFTNTRFQSNGEIAQYRILTSSNYGVNGTIEWRNCSIPDDLASNIFFTSNYGHVSALDCSGTGVGALNGGYDIKAIDFDLGPNQVYSTGGGVNSKCSLKRIWVKQANFMWPRVDGSGVSVNESTVLLPPNAVIKKIAMYYPGTGGSASTITFQFTNNDKTSVYAISNTANQNVLHTISADDLNKYCGTTTNGRTVRISCTSGSLAQNVVSEGFGYIEYF